MTPDRAFDILPVGIPAHRRHPLARELRELGGRHIAALAAHQHESVFQIGVGKEEVTRSFFGTPHGGAAIEFGALNPRFDFLPVDHRGRCLHSGSLERGVGNLDRDSATLAVLAR